MNSANRFGIVCGLTLVAALPFRPLFAQERMPVDLTGSTSGLWTCPTAAPGSRSFKSSKILISDAALHRELSFQETARRIQMESDSLFGEVGSR
jgi:hypothetical protein